MSPTTTSQAVIIGNPQDDLSGVLCANAFAERGVQVAWVTMRDAMQQMTIRGESLLDVALRDSTASTIDPADTHVVPGSQLAQAGVGLVVSNDFVAYEHAANWALHNSGMVVSNHAAAVSLAADKWRTDETLRAAGFAVPKSKLVHTVVSALVAAQELMYPVVVKQPTGTQGHGVARATNESELLDAVAELGLDAQPLIIQQYVECNSSDLRLVCIDEQFHAGILRTATTPGEFRSNTALGGSVKPAFVTHEQRTFAEGVMRALGLRFAGLDVGVVAEVLPGREHLRVGQPFCIEANTAPALYSFPKSHGIDLAIPLVESLLAAATLKVPVAV